MADAVPSSTDASPQSPDHISARGVLNVSGMRIEFDLTVPTAPVRSAAVLPILQTLWTTIEADLVEDFERQGRRISCGPGCGACCRQLVPISRIEARHLAELVEKLPEPRRSAVRNRFAEAIRRLDEAGLLETLRRPESLGPDDRAPMWMTYFQLGIPCPFLEQESCSIHTDRPLACREYLVTSPAANCANPTRDNIEGVTMPVRLSKTLGRFAEPIAPGSANWVPLILAPEWAETHPDPSPARPGPEWVTLLFRDLTGKDLPKPPTEVVRNPG
jgi:Fe-S-cluster containining protein